MHNLLTRRLEWFLRERWFVLNFHKTIQTGEGGVPSLLSRLLFAPSCVYTARLREIGTGISEASKRLPIFSSATQRGKQREFIFSCTFRQGNYCRTRTNTAERRWGQ